MARTGPFILTLSLLAGAAAATPPAYSPPRDDSAPIRPRDLRHVEAGLSDTNPLSFRGRTPPASLREPNDFKGVYRIPDEQSVRYGGWFARVRGAVIAAFPRSVYELVPLDPKGEHWAVAPAVAPGTVFFIGGIPRSFLDNPPEARSGENTGGVDTSVSTASFSDRIETAAPSAMWVDRPAARPAASSTAAHLPSAESPEALEQLRQAGLRLLTDETYRARRLDALLSGAAQQAAPSDHP